MQPPREGQRDPKAFERIIDEYADRIYSVALRITGTPEDAEDVMQETFLSAFRHWHSFRGDAAPTTWIYRIAVNAALQRIRGRRPTTSLDDIGYEEVEVVNWATDLYRRVEITEFWREIERALAFLPDDHRVAVVLRDVEGLTAAEAADVLGIGEAALKSRLHRGRVLLRQHLSTYLSNR